MPLKVSTIVRRSFSSRSRSLSVPLAFLADSMASSKCSPSMSRTVLPNIWISRRYESQAKRSLPACLARPCTDSSFSPMLRTVSIIPGIENFAPERTDTSSGSSGAPSARPIAFSSATRCSVTSARRASGSSPEPR
jgi:hypothetical protein